MSSFVFAALEPEEFDEFGKTSPQGNFQQTSRMGLLRAKHGSQVKYFGVKSGEKIVAAAAMEFRKARSGTKCSICDGPLCDLNNAELTEFFFSNLKKAVKEQKAVSLEITPETVYCKRDSNGEQIGEKNNGIVENLANAGFVHTGFTKGYTAVPRWRYVKDVSQFADEKQLLKSYDKRTQWSVKRSRSMGVKIRELSLDELEIFSNIEEQTAQRRGFKARNAQYFRDFALCFKDKVHYVVAYVDCAEFLEQSRAKMLETEEKVRKIREKIQTRETTKLVRALGEEERNLQAAKRRFDEAQKLAEQSKGQSKELFSGQARDYRDSQCDSQRSSQTSLQSGIVTVAASMFVEHPREVVYLFSGSIEEYKSFYGPVLIQHWAMENLCLKNRIGRYNFYGISGVFDDPDDEGRGVLEFKRGFGGYVEELAGEFEMPVRPLLYKVSQAVGKILG